jgi:hypothetical protein
LYKTLSQYNGAEKEHGMYKFTQIDWAKTQRLASATNLRAAVRAGDKTAFYKDMGINPSTQIEFNEQRLPAFEIVAHFLNKYPEKVKKSEVAEGHGGTQKIHDHHKAAIKNASTFASMNQSTGSAYLGYRMGIAMAGAPTYPTKIEADNWIGGDPLLSPYTDAENEMINAAAEQVGGGKRQTWSNNRSLETADVNKNSAVSKVKKNKYGV